MKTLAPADNATDCMVDDVRLGLGGHGNCHSRAQLFLVTAGTDYLVP